MKLFITSTKPIAALFLIVIHPMNTLIKLVTSLILLFKIPNDIPYNSIEKAMESNDAKTIISLGKDKILLNISGKEGAYSHSQAINIE